MMLQQTQMERGVAYFLRWMERFPHVTAVAVASEEDILRAWEGLGYYRRARFLHMAAKIMVERHGGRVPEGADALAALPGLGPYTVAAIRGIAFNHDVVVVDANVERVFSRLLNLDMPPKQKEATKRIRAEAERLLPPGKAREYNQALMELGALVCAKVPRCAECPVTDWCESRRLGLERQRPVAEAKAQVIPVLASYGILELAGRVLLVKRPKQGLWGGMWEFPGGEVAEGESPARAVERVFAKTLGLAVKADEPWGSIKHGYTNHRLTAHFYKVRMAANDASLLADLPPETACMPDKCKTGDFAMPSHHRKLAQRRFADDVFPLDLEKTSAK